MPSPTPAPDGTTTTAAADLDRQPLILGLGGTMRYGSTTARALTIAMDAVRAQGARTATIIGQQLDAPQLDFTAELTGPSVRLVEAVRRADGLILASPSYHGGISGLLKNALDHLELLREDDRPYLRDLPVGLIATGDGWQGPNSTLASMRQIVHALQGWPTPLGIAHNVTDGGGIEPVRHHLELMASQVVRFARTFSSTAT